MPVAVRIAHEKMSRADYEKVMQELEQTGHGDPDGRLSHASHGEDSVHMEETWESREQFEAHQEQRLAALNAVGFDAGIVDISELRGRSY